LFGALLFSSKNSVSFRRVPYGLGVGHRSVALVDLALGAVAGSFAGLRNIVALDPPRPKFACRIKTAYCKEQLDLQAPGISCANPTTKRRE
jgi:hypothetical protein